jgi:hypothetical protein
MIINIPDGWTRKYELNEIEFRVYDSHNVTLSLRHHLVTCNACTRLWGALEPGSENLPGLMVALS